ncbi:pilin N-terminal domain-containing protein [Enterococcus asini]|uniref:pilin N-terminal domain-containing protein n=1 Tax=Enterococcus asini TaxID=57732 RepID=UPI0022E5C977|nr:pilin N-terminal domain-containing protein [Enterococcus asini]
MRRKNKLITTILAMVMVFPFFLGLGSAKDVMAEKSTQTITLHKLAFDEMPDKIQNDGVVKPNYEVDSTPLAGAVFTAYDVTKVYWDAYDASTATDDAAKTKVAEAAVEAITVEALTAEGAYTATVFDATDDDGESTKELNKKSTYIPEGKTDSVTRNAIYRFHETVKPAGVVQSASAEFILGLPVYDEGTDNVKGEVHVYPKNEVKAVTFEFTKYGVDEGGRSTELSEANFILKDENDNYYDDGAFNASATDAEIISSDTAGLVTVAGLTLNPGTYEFYEIDSDVSVAGDQDEEDAEGNPIDEKYHYQNNPVVTVHVSKNMEVTYDYLDITGEATDETTGVEEGAKAYNYLVPSPTKIVNDSDVDVDQEITFTITQMIPQDISTYDSFVLVDDFGDNFNLISTDTDIANAAGYGADVMINASNFTVDFPIASLTGHEGETITFDVAMSLKAGVELAKDIFNNIELVNPFYNKKDKVPVQTFGKSFLKIDMDTKEALAGAKFYVKKGDLYLGTKNGKQDWSAATGEANGVPTFPAGFVATVLESPTNGQFSVAGLAQKEDGVDIDYSLKEFVAPDGYALLASEVHFTADNGTARLPVANKHKGSLPSTGGSGIVAFVLIGIVAVGGAVLYFTKGRRQIEG